MKQRISLQLFLLTLIGIFLYSCQKEDDFIYDETIEVNNFQNTKFKKLKNPYTVENMQEAFKNIKEKLNSNKVSLKNSSGLSSFKVIASHYYIKFKPETEEQEGELKKDTTMYLSDYPLDYEFADGYLKNRPKVPEGKFPEYYIAVPIAKVLPSNVPYETIEELYIPEEDPLFSDNTSVIQKSSVHPNEELLNYLLNEAYTLTGNEDDLVKEPKEGSITKAIIVGPRWWPSGTLKIWDDNAGRGTTTIKVFDHWEYYDCDDDGDQMYRAAPEERCQRAIYRYETNTTDGKFVPLVGAQVLIRQWFTVRQGITNADGYFKTSSVRGKARYVLQWERYHYSIRNGSIFQAETRGPKVLKEEWNHNIKGGDDEYHGMIHTAAHTYYYGNRFGLTIPPIRPISSQIKIAARESNPWGVPSSFSHIRSELTFGIAPHIHIKAWGSSSDVVFGTTIHELAHAAHSFFDRNSYDNIVRDAFFSTSSETRNNNRRLLETWAATVEIVFAVHRYRDHFNQSGYEYLGIEGQPNTGNLQRRTIAKENHYTSAGYDMLDNYNQRDGQNNTLYPIDRVSGYTIEQLEDALRGARYWTQWKNNIKNNYTNSTEQYLDELFDNWPN